MTGTESERARERTGVRLGRIVGEMVGKSVVSGSVGLVEGAIEVGRGVGDRDVGASVGDTLGRGVDDNEGAPVAECLRQRFPENAMCPVPDTTSCDARPSVAGSITSDAACASPLIETYRSNGQ